MLTAGNFQYSLVQWILHLAKKEDCFCSCSRSLVRRDPCLYGMVSWGGTLFDLAVLLLALFLFIWQIPHFWLLMLKDGDEYRIAGFPVMTDIFNVRQFKNIILAWVIGATGTSLFLVFSGLWMLAVSKIIIIVLNLLILSLFFKQLVFSENPRYKIMFITMNVFLIAVLSLVIIEKVIS